MQYTIWSGRALPLRMSAAQFHLHDFALRYPGWHTLGGTGNPRGRHKRTALSLERMGVLELARHSGEYGRDWQFRTCWRSAP